MTALCVVEGPDGVGKSTTCYAVARALADHNARQWFHRPQVPHRPRDPWSMALHYAAERAALAAAIRDGSEESAIILCDRWTHTASVFADVRDSDAERALPQPALVVVLDASDATLASRRPDASPDEVRARALYRDPARLARWGARVVSIEGRGAVEVAMEVAEMVAHALRIARCSCSCGASDGGGHALACAKVWGL